MPAIIEVKYFNAFILRKTYNAGDVPTWGGSRGDNTYPQHSWWAKRSSG